MRLSSAAMDYVSPHLRRENFGWHSPHLGHFMPGVRYGHWGRALVLIPSGFGDHLEAERQHLIKSIEPFLLEGKVQVFCAESINTFAWMNDQLSVPEKARRQALYSHYLEDELIPHIRGCLQSPTARLGISGVSFGAFYAATAFFHRPDLFDTLLAVSGFYDLHPDYTDGYNDDNVYFHNPLSFLPNLDDARVLEMLRKHSQVHIVTGQGQWERPENSVRLARALANQGIPHNLDLWGHDVSHDWPWWRKVYPEYVGRRLGY